ncbi:hypothetical protein MKY41_11645 [Sporosarcina sp. FSL W7-1349]|uniref:hypothetical protein n=1 Tax=Sporosarcina sp. FSL W7-1349 TaxID=2921561 RepID=UPI0030F607E9
MMDPAIERTMLTGYPYPEPVVYDRCTRCREEIHYKEEFVEAAGYAYCCKECLVDQMLEEGNANLVIAE